MIEIGKKIGERYKIKRLIGSGGMSNVYLGHDLILDRDVAVKVLRYDFQNNREALRRFQREALSVTQLIHPNIVGVYDVDEEDGQQYIVMEYVEGTDLKQYIQTVGQATPEDAVHIMSQVLSAMALAHRNRIIHRDIKPQNLLIDRDNTIKVTDFGIAVALSDTSITQTNTLLGSVHYISPEQARGSVTTVKSDIYALGIVLYELLSGEVPFDGESAVSIALKHFQEPMPTVREKNPHVPQSLENVILKASAKEPADRYGSCDEMLMDLETALSPQRAHESQFAPAAMLEETKVLEPVKIPASSVQPVSAAQVTEEVVKEPKKKKERQNGKANRSKKRGFLFGLLFLFLAIGVFIMTLVMNQEPEDIAVPTISNVTENRAKSLLEEAGLGVGETIEEHDEEIEEGYVIRTNPEAGDPVPPETEVDLYVSLGPAPVVIEDYLGENYQDVRDALRDLGFRVERVDQYDSAASGTIIDQSLTPGSEELTENTTITLTVSMGPQTFTMEDLTGYTRESVQGFANEYGLDVDFEEENSDDVAEGLVITQSIPPRSNFTQGESLVVTISAGKAEPEIVVFSKTIAIPYEAPAKPSTGNSQESGESESSAPATNHITIYMQDADHRIEDVFREFDIEESEEVTLNFRILEGESGAYIVERDGKVIMEEKNLTE
ncbi:Stk1 family PASTA domain-containing Ser/Thr kinase [Jeotgalibaca caeni]|uniref:Stk1 family PASTA domain-containing Ser/Thr kinase n=1 Tax=Jeotgalibaca caeni TaxID=3028623 RepID=UPI00237E37EE|nr:Stk1 family PASTA domain-containing Ser/Thr kinase [Jeotgalibaca caeni]MDE1548018.1 Stk1 family PASTA domain-containing Ser/Thr kinase [Jeotgalibaca caeni]